MTCSQSCKRINSPSHRPPAQLDKPHPKSRSSRPLNNLLANHRNPIPNHQDRRPIPHTPPHIILQNTRFHRQSRSTHREALRLCCVNVMAHTFQSRQAGRRLPTGSANPTGIKHVKYHCVRHNSHYQCRTSMRKTAFVCLICNKTRTLPKRAD